MINDDEWQVTDDRLNPQSNVQSIGIDKTLQELADADFGLHYLLTYPETSVWRKIYTATAREYLKQDSMVLIIPFYETTDMVRKNLANAMTDLDRYERDGSVAVIDSIKAYFSEIGLMTFVEGLLKHLGFIK